MKNKKTVLVLFMITFTLLSLLSVDTSRDLLNSNGFSILRDIVRAMISPEISEKLVIIGIESILITIVYAFAGMSLAILIGLIFGVLSSGILFNGKLKSVISRLSSFLLAFMRAIHELVWAWLFVASIGLSPLAGIFALAIPYGGMLGKIYSDMLNDVSKDMVESLKSSGSSNLQTLFYGYFPVASSKIISYTMYRFECAVRSSTILSFVGLGGIGFQIQMALYDFDFNRTWTLVYILIIAVTLFDIWSNLFRKRLIE